MRYSPSPERVSCFLVVAVWGVRSDTAGNKTGKDAIVFYKLARA